MNTTQYIPESMRLLPCWVLWRLEKRNGNTTKVPYTPGTDNHAASDNPRTWTDYRTAATALHNSRGRFNGIGFMFTKDAGLVFIDCDHCIPDPGEPDERAQTIMHAVGDAAYMEVSQSGHGIHAFVRGTLPRSFNNRTVGVEMYNWGRFVAMTGNALQAVEPAENQTGIDTVFRLYETPEKPTATRGRTGSSVSEFTWNDGGSRFTDADVITRAMNAQLSGSRFMRLYEGDLSGYDSHSEADLALCHILAYWSDRDRQQIDRIFRESGLMRDKWERDDYRQNTLDKACAGCAECFTEWQKRKKQEEVKRFAECVLSE